MAASPPSPSPKLKLRKVLSQTNRIIKAEPRHFFCLCFFFLLPPSIAAFVYPTLRSLVAGAVSNSFLSRTASVPDQQGIPTNTLLLTLAFGLFYLVFTLFAVGSITYSVINSFHGQPVKLKSAIKAASTSFFPLLATTLLISIIVFLITMFFLMVFIFLPSIGAVLLGFQIEFSSPYFIALCISMAIVLFSVLIYLQLNWVLASVVVLAETTWGFKSLKRSASLIKGRRWLALCLCFLFVFLSRIFSWSVNYSSLVVDSNDSSTSVTDDSKCLLIVFVLQLMLKSTFGTFIQLYEMVAITVLYLYCKALFDGEEFAAEYVSLPVKDDDEKVYGVVTVVSSKLDGYEV